MNRYLLSILLLLLGAQTLYAQRELPPFEPFVHYTMRESMFEEAPTHDGAIVFLGNSITDHWQWHEYFTPPTGVAILNRGIGGDITAGVLHRMPEIIRHQPSKLFLMIGINDLIGSKPNAQIIANIEHILSILKSQCPDTKIYLESILPINREIFKTDTPSVSTDNIRQVNAELSALAKRMDCTYLDIFSLLIDPETDMLRASYTRDGIHLTAQGYRLWINEITPLVEK